VPPSRSALGLLALVLPPATFVLCLALRRRYTVIVVRGLSMAPTLQPGDRLLARRIDGGSVHAGDIVILRVPTDVPDRHTGELSSTLVKRVAAVAGDPLPAVLRGAGASAADRARARARAGAVAGARPGAEGHPEGARPHGEGESAATATAVDAGCDAEVLPPGRLAVLGDNRSASVDSRAWGLIRTEDILAKVVRTL
jgi:signal peptidase I